MTHRGFVSPDIRRSILSGKSDSSPKPGPGLRLCFLFNHFLIFIHYQKWIRSIGGWSACPPTRGDRPGLHIYREDVCCKRPAVWVYELAEVRRLSWSRIWLFYLSPFNPTCTPPTTPFLEFQLLSYSPMVSVCQLGFTFYSVLTLELIKGN